MSTRPPGHVTAGAMGLGGGDNAAGAPTPAAAGTAGTWHSMMSSEDRRRVCQHLLTKMKSLYSTVADAALRQWTVNFERKAFVRATTRDEYLELIARGLTEVENLSERQRSTGSSAVPTMVAGSAIGAAPPVAPTTTANSINPSTIPATATSGAAVPNLNAVAGSASGAGVPTVTTAASAPSATASAASSLQSKGSKKTPAPRKRQSTKKQLAEQQKKAQEAAAAAAAESGAHPTTNAIAHHPPPSQPEQLQDPQRTAASAAGGGSAVPGIPSSGIPTAADTSGSAIPSGGAGRAGDQQKERAVMLMRQQIAQMTPEELMRWAHTNRNNPRAAEFLRRAAQMREAQLRGSLPPANAAAAAGVNGTTRPPTINPPPNFNPGSIVPPPSAAQNTVSSGKVHSSVGAASGAKAGKRATSTSVAAAAAAAATTVAVTAQKRPGSSHSPASVVSSGGRAPSAASAAKPQRQPVGGKRATPKGPVRQVPASQAAATAAGAGVVADLTAALARGSAVSVPSQPQELNSASQPDGSSGGAAYMEGMFSDLFSADSLQPGANAAEAVAPSGATAQGGMNGQAVNTSSGNAEFWEYLSRMQSKYRETLLRVYPRLTRMLERSEKREKFVRHLNDCINILNLPRKDTLPERYSIRLLQQVEQFIIMVFRNFRELERRYAMMQQQQQQPNGQQQPQPPQEVQPTASAGAPAPQAMETSNPLTTPGQLVPPVGGGPYPHIPSSAGAAAQDQALIGAHSASAGGAPYAPVPPTVDAQMGHTTTSTTSSRGSLSRVSGGVKKPRAPRGGARGKGKNSPAASPAAHVVVPGQAQLKQTGGAVVDGVSNTISASTAASQATAAAGRKKPSPRQRVKPVPPQMATAQAQVALSATSGPQPFAHQQVVPPHVAVPQPAAALGGVVQGKAAAFSVAPARGGLSGPSVKERLLSMDEAVKRAAEAASKLPTVTDDEVKRRKKDRVSSTFQSMVGLVWHSAAARRQPAHGTRAAVLGLDADPGLFVRPAVAQAPVQGSGGKEDVGGASAALASPSATSAVQSGTNESTDIVEERSTGRVPRSLLTSLLRRLRDKVEAECTAAQGRNPLLILELWEDFGLPIVCCWLDLPQMYFPYLVVRVTRAYGSGASPVLSFERPPLGWIGAAERARARFLDKVASASKPLVVGEILDCWAREAESAVQMTCATSMAV